jgi:hypothetical protein
LPLGQPVTFNVRLDGLTEGQKLAMLSAAVGYAGDAFFSFSPSSIARGEIVHDPLADDSGFFSYPHPDSAFDFDVAFYAGSDSSDYIRRNGVFFTFDVQIAQLGQGTLSFDPLNTLAVSADGDPCPISGATLHIASVATPEPSALALLATMAVAAGAYCFARTKEH